MMVIFTVLTLARLFSSWFWLRPVVKTVKRQNLVKV